MIEQEGYRKLHENKTIEELILERIRLLNDIIEYEKRYVIGHEENTSEAVFKPGPQTVYKMNNLYLKEITDLIVQKSKLENSTNNVISSNINGLKFVLRVEHKPFQNAYGVLEELEKNKPNNVINEYDLSNGTIIDLGSFKIEVLSIKQDSVDLRIYDNHGILSMENNFGFVVDYKNIESKGNIKLNDTLKLYKDVLDAMEDWNITLINNEKKETVNQIDEKTGNGMSFIKKKDDDIIWWVEKSDTIGDNLFTFDKKKVFNLFSDYPYKLTKEEKEIFDKENPYWADFFKDRQIASNNNIGDTVNNSNSDELNGCRIPDSLKDYVYVFNGKVYAKQKIPTNLETEFIAFKEKFNNRNVLDEYNIPESLKDYVYVHDGKVKKKKKIPKELEQQFIEFEKKFNNY